MVAGSLSLISRREGIHVITGPEMQFATTEGKKKANMVIKRGVKKKNHFSLVALMD